MRFLLKKGIIFIFIIIWIVMVFFVYQKYNLSKKEEKRLADLHNYFLERQKQEEKITENSLLAKKIKEEENIQEIANKKNIQPQIKEIFIEKEKNNKDFPLNIKEKSENSKNVIDIPTEEGVDKLIKQEKMCGEFPCYSGEEFVQLYEKFENISGLKKLLKYIYNHKKADEHIRHLAEKRGYKRRVFANENTLVSFGRYRTQKKLLENYKKMRDKMKEENISLHFVSGYRSSTKQRNIFKRKMGNINLENIVFGNYDKKINSILEKSSIPAYSKHHSGYAVDFGCGNDYLVYSFAKTTCYMWLSENNFAKAKEFGFIPSYPEKTELQGPNPEPWEFVWVGKDFISTKNL